MLEGEGGRRAGGERKCIYTFMRRNQAEKLGRREGDGDAVKMISGQCTVL